MQILGLAVRASDGSGQEPADPARVRDKAEIAFLPRILAPGREVFLGQARCGRARLDLEPGVERKLDPVRVPGARVGCRKFHDAQARPGGRAGVVKLFPLRAAVARDLEHRHRHPFRQERLQRFGVADGIARVVAPRPGLVHRIRIGVAGQRDQHPFVVAVARADHPFEPEEPAPPRVHGIEREAEVEELDPRIGHDDHFGAPVGHRGKSFCHRDPPISKLCDHSRRSPVTVPSIRRSGRPASRTRSEKGRAPPVVA